jgi:alkylated DNA nucleotide flippase Atl1
MVARRVERTAAEGGAPARARAEHRAPVRAEHRVRQRQRQRLGQRLGHRARKRLSEAYGTIARMGASQRQPGTPDRRDGRDRPEQTGESAPSETSVPAEPAEPYGPPALPEFAERVLDVADRIPPGRVMTYGDIAEWLEEGGPRQVGRVMALYGGAVPWWRVVRADGVLLAGGERAAVEHYRAEGTPLREAGPAADGHVPRIDMRRARWDGEM